MFSDVWGHACDSFGNYKYYVSFIDDFSKFTWIYLLKHKSEVFQKFHEFQSPVERQFGRKILAMQTDWGGEYEKLNSFFTKVGISHLVSCPHAHQQNGSAERKHRHIVEVGLALLAEASMPLKYWDQAFLAAVYLINRLPSRVIQHMTPLERLLGLLPSNVLILALVIFTRVINALISLRAEFISHGMLFLMRRFFLLPSFMRMLGLGCDLKFRSFHLLC